MKKEQKEQQKADAARTVRLLHYIIGTTIADTPALASIKPFLGRCFAEFILERSEGLRMTILGMVTIPTGFTPHTFVAVKIVRPSLEGRVATPVAWRG